MSRPQLMLLQSITNPRKHSRACLQDTIMTSSDTLQPLLVENMYSAKDKSQTMQVNVHYSQGVTDVVRLARLVLCIWEITILRHRAGLCLQSVVKKSCVIALCTGLETAMQITINLSLYWRYCYPLCTVVKVHLHHCILSAYACSPSSIVCLGLCIPASQSSRQRNAQDPKKNRSSGLTQKYH